MAFVGVERWKVGLTVLRALFSEQVAKKKTMSQQDLCFHFALKAKKLGAKNRSDLAYGMISHALASASLTKPNTELFNTLISVCAKQGELTLACDAFKMMKSRHVQPDSLTYVSLMNAYATTGNTLKRALMEPLSDAKRTHFMTRLLALFEEAQTNELLTTSIFNVLLKGISWLGTLEHLLMVFPLSPDEPLPVIPDCISYTTAISCVAYCGGSFTLAEAYFARMKSNIFHDKDVNIPKDVVLTMLIAYKMSIANEPKGAGRVFRKARDFALFYGRYLHDSKVLDVFLSICKLAKEYKYGLKMFERLTAGNAVPIDDSLETIHLSLLMGCHQFDQAMQLFRLIKRPSRLTINAMLQGSRMEQKFDECMQIFRVFEETPNLVPNIHSCEHAILAQIGPHFPNFNMKDSLLGKRIENLNLIMEIILKKEPKLFNFFSHASLLTKLLSFCQNSNDPKLNSLLEKAKLIGQ